MFHRKTTLMLALTAVVFLITSCGNQQDETASTLGKTERDSVLSESTLPGASTVKSALSVSDSAQARADRATAAAGK